MKPLRWISPAVIALGLLAGVAIVGNSSGTSELRLPLDAGSTSSSLADSSVPPTGPDTSSAQPSTTTVPESTTTVVEPAMVSVMVVNGSTGNSVATVAADVLSSAGYLDVVVSDVTFQSNESFVAYRDGFRRAALAVAALLSIPGEQVLPMVEANVDGINDPGDVLVVAGADSGT